ncbi:family 16 glycosylhydrolase [Treponema zuelzerae]|uniref:Family 16 glycosylhydrolase n=1 Tax=Teretinema zuelzerae TaxID=156 RepID=A0AAE3EFZ2_9SPIR|nr:glycoside hydrolase family 16 protein [Teretinema zuelzerae]MCD1653445.1 family 16 glycosylhydrolase [Teretinema zuelzerae]
MRKTSLAAMGLIGVIALVGGCKPALEASSDGGRSSGARAAFDPSDGGSWNLSWHDEFNENFLDMTKWSYDTGTGAWGWGNNELQYYTDRPDNVQVTGGNLVITAKREDHNGMPYTSGRIHTQGKYSVHYGRIAARMKLPEGLGVWPAFWMLGQDFDGQNWPAIGELDILEMRGGQDNTASAASHWDQPGVGHAMYSESLTLDEKLSEDYHVYMLEWDKQFIYASVDGEVYWTFDNFWAEEGSLPDPKAKTEFQFPMYILLNLAVGGTFFDPPLSSPSMITAQFPQAMMVDWIRVYTKDDLAYKPWTPGGNSVNLFSETLSANKFVAEDEWNSIDAWAETLEIETTKSEKFEGSESLKLTAGNSGWLGLGMSSLTGKSLKNFTDGYLRFAIKTTSSGLFRVGMKSGPIMEQWVDLNSEYGFSANGQWKEVSIPLSAFMNQNQYFNITQLTQMFMFVSTGGFAPGDVIYLDNIHFWTDNPKDSDDPVIDDPVIDDPVIDDPVIDDPVIDDPVIDDPVIAPGYSFTGTLPNGLINGQPVEYTTTASYSNGITTVIFDGGAGFEWVWFFNPGHTVMTNSGSNVWKVELEGYVPGSALEYRFTVRKNGQEANNVGASHVWTVSESTVVDDPVVPGGYSFSGTLPNGLINGAPVSYTTTAELKGSDVHVTFNGGAGFEWVWLYSPGFTSMEHVGNGVWRAVLSGYSAGSVLDYRFTVRKDGQEANGVGTSHTWTVAP